jgi:hypothetical protein
MQRRRFKQTAPPDQRLMQEAERLRKEAQGKPPGIERERLIRRARQAETAAHMQEWLTSPGLSIEIRSPQLAASFGCPVLSRPASHRAGCGAGSASVLSDEIVAELARLRDFFDPPRRVGSGAG